MEPSITLRLAAPVRLEAIALITLNGNGGRAKEVVASFVDGTSETLTLNDTSALQVHTLRQPRVTSAVTLTITATAASWDGSPSGFRTVRLRGVAPGGQLVRCGLTDTKAMSSNGEVAVVHLDAQTGLQLRQKYRTAVVKAQTAVFGHAVATKAALRGFLVDVESSLASVYARRYIVSAFMRLSKMESRVQLATMAVLNSNAELVAQVPPLVKLLTAYELRSNAKASDALTKSSTLLSLFIGHRTAQQLATAGAGAGVGAGAGASAGTGAGTARTASMPRTGSTPAMGGKPTSRVLGRPSSMPTNMMGGSSIGGGVGGGKVKKARRKKGKATRKSVTNALATLEALNARGAATTTGSGGAPSGQEQS